MVGNLKQVTFFFDIFTWYVGCGDWTRDATKVEHEAEFRGFPRMWIEGVENGRENHAGLMMRKSLNEEKQLQIWMRKNSCKLEWGQTVAGGTEEVHLIENNNRQDNHKVSSRGGFLPIPKDINTYFKPYKQQQQKQKLSAHSDSKTLRFSKGFHSVLRWAKSAENKNLATKNILKMKLDK